MIVSSHAREAISSTTQIQRRGIPVLECNGFGSSDSSRSSEVPEVMIGAEYGEQVGRFWRHGRSSDASMMRILFSPSDTDRRDCLQVMRREIFLDYGSWWMGCWDTLMTRLSFFHPNEQKGLLTSHRSGGVFRLWLLSSVVVDFVAACIYLL